MVFLPSPLFFGDVRVFLPQGHCKQTGQQKKPLVFFRFKHAKTPPTPQTWTLKPLSRAMVHIGVSKNSGTPQIIHFNRVFQYKPSILGYPYFWKHPYLPRLRRVFYRMRDMTQLPDGCGGRDFFFAVGRFWGVSPKSGQGKTVVKVTLKKKEWTFWVIKTLCRCDVLVCMC